MDIASGTIGEALLETRLGNKTANLLAMIDLDGPLAEGAPGGGVSQACFAAAVNAVLFHDLLPRVPTGAAFVAEQGARGERIAFDHGAIRTIRFPDGNTGGLRPGQETFTRILSPLGYEVTGTYPLPHLRMTGRAWTHRERPEELPQFFVSELHVDRFDPEFALAARRVFGSSVDPLTTEDIAWLNVLARDGELPLATARLLLPAVVSAFDRQHAYPDIADYELLLAGSAEAAWIATEGNAFNHATSRVADVEAEAEHQRAAGRPIKDRVEISASGRVRQTAFQADSVVRRFRDGRERIERTVPGSFYEIITRDIDPETGKMDLRFDSSNATGIFAMTRAA